MRHQGLCVLLTGLVVVSGCLGYGRPRRGRPNAVACDNHDQCQSGHCVAGLCCDRACAGGCNTCAGEAGGTGIPGTCSTVTAGTDPHDACAGIAACNGAGECFATELGGPCSHHYECTSETCAPEGVCCESACDGPCETCSLGICEPVADGADPDDECGGNAACNGERACWTREVGALCDNSYQCQSGFCADGVCCGQACDLPCRRCDSPSNPGQCVAVLSGSDDTCNATTPGDVCTEPPCQCDAIGSCDYDCAPDTFRCNHGCCMLGSSIGFHSCAATRKGVFCWGYNVEGEVGPNCTASICDTPVVVPGPTGATKVIQGDKHSCALTTSGVWCWGLNSGKQLGGDCGGNVCRTPLKVAGLDGVTDIATGAYHTCALVSGVVYCWGSDNMGQVGDGGTCPANGTFVSAPTAVSGLTNVTAITAGAYFTCALTGAGKVWCWGENKLGELGGNVTGDCRSTPIEIKVPAETKMTAIAAGGWFACAQEGSAMWCWGHNGYGEAGPGCTTGTCEPTKTLASGVRAIYAGRCHTAAQTDSGVLFWGRNACNQLGLGCGAAVCATPATISSPTNITHVALGGENTCVEADGGVWCWGAYSSGTGEGACAYCDSVACEVPASIGL